MLTSQDEMEAMGQNTVFQQLSVVLKRDTFLSVASFSADKILKGYKKYPFRILQFFLKS